MMSTFSFLSLSPSVSPLGVEKSCARIQWRSIAWLMIVILFLVFVVGVYSAQRSDTSSRRMSHDDIIDVEDGGILNIYTEEHFGVEDFATVSPRKYPFRNNQSFKLKAKKYIPFIVQIPGVPGECDFEGTTTTRHDPDIIIVRQSDALDRIKPPGKCNNREYFQIVPATTGTLKFSITYSHRNGSTLYNFEVLVS